MISAPAKRTGQLASAIAALLFALMLSLSLVLSPAVDAKPNDNASGQAAAVQQDERGKPDKADKPSGKPDKPSGKPAGGATHVAKPAGDDRPGSIQGNSPSDPDGNENGGVDKPGGTGSISGDRDGNNGCGNDDDREDDNRGNCGPRGGNAGGNGGGDGSGNGGNGNGTGAGGSAGGAGDDAGVAAAACSKALSVVQQLLALLGIDFAPGEKACRAGTGGSNDGSAGAAQADAGKVTICHATGSATNPFVEITISENGLSGHGDHEGDIIPAPAGGCPELTTPDDGDGDATGDDAGDDAAGDDAGEAPGKITICHATGSATNPFVEITISVNGLNGHADHEGDLIPAPAGGCPTLTTPDEGREGQDTSPPGTVTLCHATGSATNPFVEITISENGLNGHDGHEGDLIPMPAGGCPVPAGGAGQDDDADGGGAGDAPGKVTICHATGSATNPFVEITISENGLNGHAGHDGDLIPMPAGGCPVPAAANGGGDGGGGAGGDAGGGDTGTAGTAGAAEGGDSAAGGATNATDATEGGGEGAEGKADGTGATATAGAQDAPEGSDLAGEQAAADDGSLPFTGLALGALALLAAAALATGWASHRHGGRQKRQRGAR